MAIPPADLMADCIITDTPIRTNGDLPRATRSLRTDLAKCNADKKALRAWAEDTQAK